MWRSFLACLSQLGVFAVRAAKEIWLLNKIASVIVIVFILTPIVTVLVARGVPFFVSPKGF